MTRAGASVFSRALRQRQPLPHDAGRTALRRLQSRVRQACGGEEPLERCVRSAIGRRAEDGNWPEWRKGAASQEVRSEARVSGDEV